MEEIKRKVLTFAFGDIQDALDRIEKEYKDYNLADKPYCVKEDVVIDVILQDVKQGIKYNIESFINKLDRMEEEN